MIARSEIDRKLSGEIGCDFGEFCQKRAETLRRGYGDTFSDSVRLSYSFEMFSGDIEATDAIICIFPTTKQPQPHSCDLNLSPIHISESNLYLQRRIRRKHCTTNRQLRRFVQGLFSAMDETHPRFAPPSWAISDMAFIVSHSFTPPGFDTVALISPAMIIRLTSGEHSGIDL